MPGIDFHTHLAPLVDGPRRGPERLYDPDALVADLDRLDLDAAVVSIPPPFFRQELDAAGAAAWVREANEGLLRAIGDRDRLLALAYLPLEHPGVAAGEYARVRADERFAGVVGSAGGGSASMADPALEPLWSALSADRRLVLLHPGASPDPRLEAFYLHNLLGNPVETAVAVGQLVFGDVLRRHPGMRVVLVHCGGAVPGLVGRWQRGFDTSRPGVSTDAEPPREAVRRLWTDCLAHDPALVDHAAETFGEDHLLLGSDWPFPMGTDDPAGQIAHRGEAFVRRVAVDNARAALGR